jgi:SH3 domain-containing YSC84-like protein 1
VKGLAIAASIVLATSAFGAGKAQERLEDSARVFSEIMRTPDKGIPQDLLAKAECVVIIPGLKKAAFVVGAEYGRGFAECRKIEGRGWGAPAAVRMEGGSVGFQLGGSDTDMVLLLMNRHGMTKLTEDKFTLGADASVAAGPVGRTANASTDAEMTAEILAWSRARGLFAGISVKGATLRPSQD